MFSQIVWPQQAFEKGNPFGGNDGIRSIRITFHDRSFISNDHDEKAALDILMGLARLDDIDAMSFNGLIQPDIILDKENWDSEYVGITVKDEERKTKVLSSVSTSYLKPSFIAYLLGIYISTEEEKYKSIRQELLEANSHVALRRDIFITLSPFLLQHRHKLEEINIYSPRDALKIVGLYLRMKGEFEWTSHIQDKAHYLTTRQDFYQLLSRGLLPHSWTYLSSLGLHHNHEQLIPLGWSVLDRYSRALQARDEIGRLFYMQNNSSSNDKMVYHFDYLTLLLTAVLDAQALIINKIYNLDLKDNDCGLRREKFKKKIENNPSTRKISNLLDDKRNLIEILFDLRNKIHSVGIDTNFHVPISIPDDLLERIFQYESNDHWGVKKHIVTVIVNHRKPVPSIDYSVDLYSLAHNIVNETTVLINSLMMKTEIERYLDPNSIPKILSEPPTETLPFIQTYLLLA